MFCVEFNNLEKNFVKNVLTNKNCNDVTHVENALLEKVALTSIVEYTVSSRAKILREKTHMYVKAQIRKYPKHPCIRINFLDEFS